MKSFIIKNTPKVLLKYYNLVSTQIRFRKHLQGIGLNVSINKSKLGTNNTIGSNVLIFNLSSGNNLRIGNQIIIKNSVLGNDNIIRSKVNINDCTFGDNAIICSNCSMYKSRIGNYNKIHINTILQEAKVGDYTYIGQDNFISKAHIGKFCSIGPNLFSGWGVHLTNGISTHPMFYSTRMQNGITFSPTDKIIERIPVKIGNDVFIGMNVLILDGIKIGDGAIIGAGAVVSKNIPPYAIAVGSPIQIIKYRYSPEIIEKLLEIQWWNWSHDKLKEVEKYLNDIESFIAKYEKGN